MSLRERQIVWRVDIHEEKRPVAVPRHLRHWQPQQAREVVVE